MSDFERKDVSTPLIGATALAIFLLGLSIFATTAEMFNYLKRAFPGQESSEITRPPEPRLQTRPRSDFERYLEKENRLLDSYGWVDRSRDRVHIPIARAMEIYANRK